MIDPPRRPDPDALLEQVRREEAKARRGRLKVFFGMAPGVGKTYAMLEAAAVRRADGVDLVIGIVETHKRAETAALLGALEELPTRTLEYRGSSYREFDLDAALARRPALIVVDELAHSNVEGSRHSKRWQDVEELLAAGIDVYTTLNVQHLESVSDVVGQITGIRVQETLPDQVFEGADEVELIDLTPDELLERLEVGKVYLGEQAARAADNFFRKGNLIALRELALRRTADRVDAQMRDYRDQHRIAGVWPVAERLLVAISPLPDAEDLVREGKRLADALGAEWIVAYVETPRMQRLDEDARGRVLKALELAEQLGARTVTLAGPLISAELLAYAETRNVSKILVGKPHTAGWKRWLFGSATDALISHAGNIDIYIVGAAPVEDVRSRARRRLFARSPAYSLLTAGDRSEHLRRRSAMGVLVIAACTGLAMLMAGSFSEANLVMVYLLGVVFTSVRYGRAPGVVASVLAVLAFDFFFVPPQLTFAVSDVQYVVTFGVMLAVALIISRMASGLRLQARVAAFRERRSSELFEMSRELLNRRSAEEIAAIGVRHVRSVFDAQASVLTPAADGRLQAVAGADHVPERELSVAQWVFDHRQAAGRGTDTLPGAEAMYLPMPGSAEPLGVLAVRPRDWEQLRAPEQLRHLEVFASQIALALERVRMSDEAARSRVDIETERLRSSLLSAISHDLRTPLATILGNASQLAAHPPRDEAQRQQMAGALVTEAERMTDLVNKVLEMARLQAGRLQLKPEWSSLEEIVGSALAALRRARADHPVEVAIPPTLGLVRVDALLVERAIANLVENALKYTPPGTRITIGAERRDSEVIISVGDDGPGLPAGSEEAVFDKFYRIDAESAQSGVGLGLAICRIIVDAHGGRIWAERGLERGALFHFSLPQREPPPTLDVETEHDP